MHRFLLLAAVLAGCIPSFEKVDCYSELDCPADFACVAGACAAKGDAGGDRDADPTADADLDASQVDSASDAGEPDADDRDVGPEDQGVLDSGGDAGYLLQASPTSIDFGARPVNCVGPDEPITLTNLGVNSITVTNLALAGGTSPAFDIGAVPTPFTLDPANSQDLPVSFLPTTTGVHNGRVLVTYTPEPLPLTVNITGRGVAGSTVTDAFTQGAGPIDILFVIDTNDAMIELQTELASEAIFLISRLDNEGWDYQIGVTDADLTIFGAEGALIGSPPFITPLNVVDPQLELESRVMLGDFAFPGDEGLEAMRLALSAPLITVGANFGFLRPNAALLVILLAKQPDNSAMNVSAYVSFLDGLKSDAALSQANAIVPNVTACTLDEGTGTYGGRQIGLATDTGGVISDACGVDYFDAMTTLPLVPLGRTFPLDFLPANANAIEVRVGGVLVPRAGNWTYDNAQNAVVFNVAREPQLGELIEITYPAGC